MCNRRKPNRKKMMIPTIHMTQRNIFIAAAGTALLALLTTIYVASTWYHDWRLTSHPVTYFPQVSGKKDHSIEKIPDMHIFGQALIATGDMPITSLQLTVTGIVREQTTDDNNLSKAYISISGGQSKIYHVGETLPDGVKIYDITPDTVILENGGRLEKLPLPREKLEFKPQVKNSEDSL